MVAMEPGPAVLQGTQGGARPVGVPTVSVVVPVYRDWVSASRLCAELDTACARLGGAAVHVLLVDDGSPDGMQGWQAPTRHHLQSIRVLFLRRNLGHQRAIAAGLCHVHAELPCDAVLVMDADGEDRPDDAVTLIARALATPGRIVFAERRRRVEGLVFRAGYVLYRLLHRLLTGESVRVGNFSVVPASALPRLVCMAELWNHYAGAVFVSRLAYDTIPLDRGRRYHGHSRMNVAGLVSHGLAGISTYQDIVATRVLVTSSIAAVLTLVALVAVVGVRLFTDLAIPGWATYAAGLLLLLLAQIGAAAFGLVFTVLAGRRHLPFVPSRDYTTYVDRVEVL